MKAKTLVDFLKLGGVRRTTYRDNDTTLIGYINLALIELYKRFNLGIKTEVVVTYPNIFVYELRNDDISQVFKVTDEDNNILVYQGVACNDDFDFTQVALKTFIIKNPTERKLLFFYKSSPQLISSLEDEVDIPYDMIEAVISYVDYRIDTTIDYAIGRYPKYDYFARFEYVCNDLVKRGYANDSFYFGTTVRDKGYA